MNDQAKAPSEIAVIRHQLGQMEGELKSALPAHIPVERFMRVVMTAIQNNGDLLKCDRRSFFNASVKAAQDGLLPDGREGAIVPYKTQAQWMPMIGGLRKKARNSGEIATWDVQAAFENDVFDFELGDNPFIKHKPTLGDPGKIIAVYSIAVLKSGEISRDVMSVFAVEKIRTKSRGTNTPWNDPIFYPEMAKKTVARRHSKTLPTSSDLDDLLRRDDALYDIEGESDRISTPRPKTLGGRLDALADMVGDDGAGDNEEQNPAVDMAAKKSESGSTPAQSDAPGKQASTAKVTATEQQPSSGSLPQNQSDDGNPIATARARGAEARHKGMSRKALPAEYRKDEQLMGAYLDGFDTGNAEREPGEEG